MTTLNIVTMATQDGNQFLLSKIDAIETRLESHVAKIESRLDQMIALMQAVATLQEKESRNADGISELKGSLRDSLDKFERAVERIHQRLDKQEEENEREQDTIHSRIRDMGGKIAAVDERVSKWMDRGIGLWIGISALVVVIQTIGGFMISSFKDEYNATKTQISEMAKRQNEIENDISRINSNIRNLPAANPTSNK